MLSGSRNATSDEPVAGVSLTPEWVTPAASSLVDVEDELYDPGGVASSYRPTRRASSSGSCTKASTNSLGPPRHHHSSSHSAEMSHDRSVGNIRSGSPQC